VTIVKTDKLCTRCNRVFPIEAYKTYSNGVRASYCDDCIVKYNKGYVRKDMEEHKRRMRARYWEDPEKYIEKEKQRRTGAPPGTYEFLMREQNGLCAICGADKSNSKGDRLSIDHDRETDEIRGLLCTNCNQGIGSFKHNPQLLAAAIKYLMAGKKYSIQELQLTLQAINALEATGRLNALQATGSPKSLAGLNSELGPAHNPGKKGPITQI
jgi:hypothetical protein